MVNQSWNPDSNLSTFASGLGPPQTKVRLEEKRKMIYFVSTASACRTFRARHIYIHGG